MVLGQLFYDLFMREIQYLIVFDHIIRLLSRLFVLGKGKIVFYICIRYIYREDYEYETI